MPDKLLFELSSEGKTGFSLPTPDVPAVDVSSLLPPRFLRQHEPALPQVSEREVVQHFVRISILNHHVDKGFYPLGSCTMKYNPKVHEDLARLPGFSALHPYQPEETAQGALRLMHELSSYLCEIAGMKAVCLQPAAGAHGELTGLMMIRAYHEDRGKPRKKVLIPDSAHGTNPASATICGYEAVQVRSNQRGMVDLDTLKGVLDEDTAALMLTNPNTLGIFEAQVKEIAERVHSVGALMYMDGANLNALLGIARPGDVGFDVVHFNLHKTFSTPHGGGGPGAGPTGVSDKLVDYLPVPVVERRDGQYLLNYDRPKSIGKISTFYGNFGVLVRAYVYIRMLGARGLKAVSENAIINANYLLSKLRGTYPLAYEEIPMHEFVISGEPLKKFGVKTLDVAKRLLDFGFHAPTIYFPLIVKEALMIEPTETESKATLDAFAEALLAIAREAEQNPEVVLSAPHATPVPRLDEARAAKELNVRYRA